MDDWQEAQFSNRHVHNRIGKHGRSKGGKSNSAFDVHRTFGTYEMRCAAAQKLVKADQDNARATVLELYNLNDTGNALIGEIILPQVLHATVVLAASRKVMNRVIKGLEDQTFTKDDDPEYYRRTSDDEQQDDAASQDPSKTEDDELPAIRQDDTFEKNSFRSPKFWIRWQGRISLSEKESDRSNMNSAGSGYLVFTGNDCSQFQGTLNCEALKWDNVKLTGRKIASRSARDHAVTWLKEQG